MKLGRNDKCPCDSGRNLKSVIQAHNQANQFKVIMVSLILIMYYV